MRVYIFCLIIRRCDNGIKNVCHFLLNSRIPKIEMKSDTFRSMIITVAFLFLNENLLHISGRSTFSCPKPLVLPLMEHSPINFTVADLYQRLNLPSTAGVQLMSSPADSFHLEGGALKVKHDIDREGLCNINEYIICCVDQKPPKDDSCVIKLDVDIYSDGSFHDSCTLQILIKDRYA